MFSKIGIVIKCMGGGVPAHPDVSFCLGQDGPYEDAGSSNLSDNNVIIRMDK